MALIRKLQVFVSSTFTDLREERQAAVAAILKAGHIPAGMELFAAGNEEQLQVIRRWIDDSDVFVLLLGKRYGSLEPKSKKSYTHLEYEYAVEQHKKLFAVVLDDAIADRKVREGGMSGADVYEQDNSTSYKKFSELVRSKMCSFASDLKDIRLHVGENLRELERHHEFSGWVPGRSLQDNSKTLEDMAAAARATGELQAENERLRTEVQRLETAAAIDRRFDGHTFEELQQGLRASRISITFSDSPKPREMNLDTAITLFAPQLAIGVRNAKDAEGDEFSVFRNVAAPLLGWGLAEYGRVPATVYWQRLILSKLGQQYLAERGVRVARSKAAAAAVNVSPAAPPAAESALVAVAEPPASPVSDGSKRRKKRAKG